jgi:hypothetical protein
MLECLWFGCGGNVTDNAGATVAGATVTITNKGTNQSREVATGEDGIAQFPRRADRGARGVSG